MIYSQLDLISLERSIIEDRASATGFFRRGLDSIINPRNPGRTFFFYVPSYLYLRSGAICEDVAAETEKNFNKKDLARVLFDDFLYYARTNTSLKDLHNMFIMRDKVQPVIKPYQDGTEYNGIISDKARGFDRAVVTISHKDALRGEYLLCDMAEFYPGHGYTLEDILTIIYCDFVDDYRKGTIKNPVAKILNYM